MSAVDILRAEIARRREEAERLLTYCTVAQQLLDVGEFSAIQMMGYSWPETVGKWESGRQLTTLAGDAETEARDAQKAARDAAKAAVAVADEGEF